MDFRNKASQAAVRKGFPQATEMLLIARANADLKDENERTPLSRAAERRHEAAVKMLVATGEADADSTDKHG